MPTINMKELKIIDIQLLNEVSEKAKASPRLRMNYNFHQSLDDKCHRMLNALEPGTEIPIHRHPSKDETIVILEGRAKVFTYNSRGTMKSFVVLDRDGAHYGVNIPKNTWHTLESLEPDSVIFECKEGPFVKHEVEGVLKMDDERC